MRYTAAAAATLACLSQLGGTEPAHAAADRGSIALLDARSGRQLAHVRANGAVVTAIPDGRGGWFVGGSFTRLGGKRRIAVAHVLPSGAVDPRWRARIASASGRPVAVYALARAGKRLFVAGPFGRVGGVQRPGLAAVDASSGRVDREWTPKPAAWPDVQALLVAGRRLLVARNGGYPIPGIAALNARTGSLDRRWNANLVLIPDAGSFNTLLLRGSRVYVAGTFRVAGQKRDGLVAFEVRTGRAAARFAPRLPSCSVCNGFAVAYGLAVSGRRLYVSGHFDRIAGVTRNGVAALDARTGALDRRWRPRRGGRDVLRLALAGSRLYLGGMSGLHALDANTGQSVRFPDIDAPRHVLALTASGRRLLVGGRD